MHAGREIRVIVQPEDVDDDAAALLSHQIAREVEKELEYPGQIKVTVIRESRATDYAQVSGVALERVLAWRGLDALAGRVAEVSLGGERLSALRACRSAGSAPATGSSYELDTVAGFVTVRLA